MKIYFLLPLLFISSTLFAQMGFVIDHRHTDLTLIPDEYITAAKDNLRIHYFRRSHGSHIDVGGMAALRRYTSAYDSKYAYDDTQTSGSLYFSTTWISLDSGITTGQQIDFVQYTRDYLNDAANSDINVVMWAWSSGFYLCSVTAYLNGMETLINEYGPGGSKIISGDRNIPVTFIYQTACGQESISRNETVYVQNKEIRDYCVANNKILFDFNDIETFNPDGEYFGDAVTPNGNYTNARMLNDDLSYNLASGRGNWGIEWNNANPTTELAQLSADDICTVCEHSMGFHENETKDNSRLHCVLKGRAAWWMWAVLAGWQDGVTTKIEQKHGSFSTGVLNNYPNPFETSTTIVYELKNNAQVVLEIWNSKGQKINTLVNQKQKKGKYSLPVNLANEKGIYFYTLNINGVQISNKMIKIK